MFSTGEPLSKTDAAHARQCRQHTALLAQSRHAVTRQRAESDARMHARQVRDPALRQQLYRAIVEAAQQMTEGESDATA